MMMYKNIMTSTAIPATLEIVFTMSAPRRAKRTPSKKIAKHASCTTSTGTPAIVPSGLTIQFSATTSMLDFWVRYGM